MLWAMRALFIVKIIIIGCLTSISLARVGNDIDSGTSTQHQSRKFLRKSESLRRKLVASNFTGAIAEAHKTLNLIYQRFEFKVPYRFQFFIGSANIPDHAWDILKYKFASKMLTPNSKFFMIFGGSSVTAGHDNYYHQAYPFVFERRMKPIFDALGLSLVVRNIAMGANNCRPSDLCYEAQGGDNPDWLSWEQSYNCGKDRGVFELMARIAYWNKAIIYYVASGAFTPKECLPSKDPIPWIKEEWTPEKAGITDFFAPSKTDADAYRTKLNDWFKDGNSVARFTDSLGPDYRSVGYHGFSVWGHSNSLCFNDYTNQSGCNAIDMRGRCYDAGGPHWMIQETATYGKEGGDGANWHPPAGMHLLRGESLAYNYAFILLDAILTVQEDLKTLTAQQAVEGYLRKLHALQSPPIPAAHHCKPECETKPVCYTNYQPHYNPPYTLDMIIVGNRTGWQSAMKDGNGPDPAKYGYPDKKPCYEAKGEGHEIHLKVTVGKARFFKLCGYRAKESLKHANFYLDANVHSPGPDYVPSPNRVQLTNRKYVGDECTQLSDVPEGNHVVTVQTHSNKPGHITSLSHLVTYL